MKSLSIRIRVRSSPAWPSPACSPTTALRSAWTAKGLGGTMSSSSSCGAASNTKRYTCGPTTASARPALHRPLPQIFIMVGGHTRALTARHPIKLTSSRCPSARQPNLSRRSTYRRGKSVQTTGTSSRLLVLGPDGKWVGVILTPMRRDEAPGSLRDASLAKFFSDEPRGLP